MRSQPLPKRHSIWPRGEAERPAAAQPVRPRGRERLLLWSAAIALGALACTTSWALERQIEHGLAAQLALLLAAEVEVTRALLSSAADKEQPRSPALDASARGDDASARVGRALQRLPGLAPFGANGEAYAFDRTGTMLTPSRLQRTHGQQNLWSSRAGQQVIELRDPGGPGAAPRPRAQQPLTRMAAAALRGQHGVDVDGYRDYRGVRVVGAWTWLPEYDLGLAVELDEGEALALHQRLRWVHLAVYAAFAAALLAMGSSSRAHARARTQIEHARQLGQYTLVRELGRGGMGTVYEARHALLRRPTAVKLMHAPSADEEIEAEALLRFEREVQHTSQLSHPNTVVIYDYGRTEEGVFYYAMEYIDGVDLEHLVQLDGPLAPGRVIHLALQVCGSLAEAHQHALIHRDVKPANILICERGGVPDCIKVLDFGLVKSLHGPQVSAAHVLVGTPQFMAPEVLREPARADARSDLYALGAVMYWLIAGRTVFDAGDALAAVREGAEVTPPSAHRPGVPPDLEQLVLRCLARDPQARPASMDELAMALTGCRDHGRWSSSDARRYWRERGALFARDRRAAPDAPTLAAT